MAEGRFAPARALMVAGAVAAVGAVVFATAPLAAGPGAAGGGAAGMVGVACLSPDAPGSTSRWTGRWGGGRG
jgi:hypothetical protein